MILPVSGIETSYRPPNGNDDLAILEAPGNPVERAMLVLSRLCAMDSRSAQDADRHSWRQMTITDFEVALLGLRRYLFGDSVACYFRAANHNSGQPLEVQFSIHAFLEGVKAEIPKGLRRNE